MTILPPDAIGEDLSAQSNAWLNAATINERDWQRDALDYTRSFRAKFPAWARAYEQQTQGDTNSVPFTAEDQARISALATELEKLQMEAMESHDKAAQERAIGVIGEIGELMPRRKNGGSQGQPQSDSDKNQSGEGQTQQQPAEAEQQAPDEPEEKDSGEESDEPTDEEKEVDAILRKAQERSDEHEAEKKARMRKAPLSPNERDW